MLKSLVSLTTVCALALTAPLAFADPEDPAPVPGHDPAQPAGTLMRLRRRMGTLLLLSQET